MLSNGDRFHVSFVCKLGASFLFAVMNTASILPTTAVNADIFRWDNQQLIPGIEGITLGPGMQLDHRELEFAELISYYYLDGFRGVDLTGSHFEYSNLNNAQFSTRQKIDPIGANLTDAQFTEASLVSANLESATLTHADLSRANLRSALLASANFTSANLTAADLTHATMWGANLLNANLTGANLSSASLANANLMGAQVTSARFGVNSGDIEFGLDIDYYGQLTEDQLYSTASYHQKDLRGIVFENIDLAGWDFSGQNLSGASFYTFDLKGAFGLTNLENANLTGTNLTNAFFVSSNLTNADLTAADTRGSNLISDVTKAILKNTILPDGQVNGLDLTQGEKLNIRNYVIDPLQGLGPIPITIQSDMRLGDGTLEMLFDANSWESLISFQPGIAVQLGGTLELTFASEVSPSTQVGRTLHIFDWTGVSPVGQFHVASKHSWDLTKLYTTGEIALLSPIAGDFNDDESVDAADANVFLGNWGSNGIGDLNGDQIVDAADAGILFASWTGDAQAVPEPSGCGLFILGTLLLFRRQVFAATLSTVFMPIFVVIATSSARADIFRWDTGEVIPGTEDIDPLPNAQLDHRNLRFANLSSANLTGANFHQADLTSATFDLANLSNANLIGSDLSHAYLGYAKLAGADLTDAIVLGTAVNNSMLYGLSAEQFYTTASYKARNLTGIRFDFEEFGNPDVTGWNFAGQNLTNSSFFRANASRADFTAADLRGARLSFSASQSSTLTNAILPDGTIAGLNLFAGDTLTVRNYLGHPNEGQSPILVTVQNHTTMSDGSILELRFDVDTWDSLISFQTGIPVQLGGTLELTFADGTDLATQVGRTLHIFDWTGVNPTGQFHVASPYTWDLAHLYSTGEVTLLSVNVGDMNADGTIDAADAGLMFANWGNSGQGDLNFDGIVDAADAGMMFEKWTGDSATGVPEPSSACLAALGIMGLLLRRRTP